jgi:hypothetical protein
MEGYDLVTSDGERLGHVVGVAGDKVIVEHGLLRKSRHAVPTVFVHVDDGKRVVRTTLSRELIEDSPEIGENGDLDDAEVAAYYGLAAGEADASSEGYGEVNPDDPALTADQEGLRVGVTPADQGRAEIRKNLDAGTTYGSPGRPIIPPDPHTSSRPGDYDEDR